MRRSAAILGAFIVGGLLAPPWATAQICAGSASLRSAPVQTGVGAASYTYATTVRSSISLGRAVFATLAGGRSHDAEIHATAWEAGILLGYDGILDTERTAFFCPRATFSYTMGPDDLLFNGYGYRRAEGSLGLGLALILARTERLDLVSVAGGSVHRLRAQELIEVVGDHGVLHTKWDTYGQFALTLGLVLDERITIRPELTVPFGLTAADSPDWYVAPFGREGGEIGLGLSVAVAFGSSAEHASEPARVRHIGPTVFRAFSPVPSLHPRPRPL